jgi:hypothetical protein
MATIPAAGYLSTSTRTKGEAKPSLEDLIASLRQVPGAGQTELTSTIVSGSVTPAGSGGVVVIDTESSAATDDLTNIVTTDYPDGACLLIRNANAARVVTIKHGSAGIGPVQLDRSVDYVLDDTKKWLLCVLRSGIWYEILRGPSRLVSTTVAKTAAFTVSPGDDGRTFTCTGTFTITLAAAALFGNGFIFNIVNAGTGTVTIDPNASELFDTTLTTTVPTGWSIQFMTQGSSWTSVCAHGPEPTENPIVNGAMNVWQRGTTFPSTLSGGATWFAADRWLAVSVGSTSISTTMNRSTNVPTVAQAGVLFNYSLELDVTTAYGSMAASDRYGIFQAIEGFTWRHFAQRAMTVSFWVMSSKTGTHSVSLRNIDSSRTLVATYTIGAADTWEYKSITVPASPSTGTWNYADRTGLFINWALACGSSGLTSTINSWQSADRFAGTGQVNCLDNTANFFRLTGVKIDLGSFASPFDVTSFESEYLRCQRYYQKSFDYATAPATNVGSNTGEWIFAQPVSASTLFNTEKIPFFIPMSYLLYVDLFNPNAANDTDCTGSTDEAGSQENSFTLNATTPGGSAAGNILAVHWQASCEF